MESILFHHIMGSTALWFSWFLGYQKLCLNQNSEITFTNPMYPLLYFITHWEFFRVLEKLFVVAFACWSPYFKVEKAIFSKNKTPYKLNFARNKTWHSHARLHKLLEYFKPELTQDHILLARFLHFFNGHVQYLEYKRPQLENQSTSQLENPRTFELESQRTRDYLGSDGEHLIWRTGKHLSRRTGKYLSLIFSMFTKHTSYLSIFHTTAKKISIERAYIRKKVVKLYVKFYTVCNISIWLGVW